MRLVLLFFRWAERFFMLLVTGVQLLGNGWVIINKLQHSKEKSDMFITSLAFSDLFSALASIVGSYKEEIGRTTFYWPKDIGPLF